jgi:pyruvyl transferase EpsO
MATSKEIISSVCNTIDSVLKLLVPAGPQNVALIDWPHHSNVGDSAIAMGELAWLGKNDHLNLAYICDVRTYNKKLIKESIGDGIIFLHGGGNLGDLWPPFQLFREKVIQDFPENRIIQLPQSIYFLQKDSLHRFKEVVEKHKNLTLLVRDEQSLANAKKEFKVDISLCPDMAFELGALPRGKEALVDVVGLFRTDKEASDVSFLKFPNQSIVFDWLEEPKTFQLLKNYLLALCLKQYPNQFKGLNPFLSKSTIGLGRERLRRGCGLLEQGNVVVTDRLHGHILSLLLNIPHFLADNSYWKNKGFYDCWTKDCDIVYWCSPDGDEIDVYDVALKKGWLMPKK